MYKLYISNLKTVKITSPARCADFYVSILRLRDHTGRTKIKPCDGIEVRPGEEIKSCVWMD